jgi:hypothetical protein
MGRETADVFTLFTQITYESVFQMSPLMPACQVGLGLGLAYTWTKLGPGRAGLHARTEKAWW